MKKILLYGSLAVMAMGMASCNDFLDDNRYPLDAQSNSPDFWNNATNLETQCAAFYNIFEGYGNGTGINSQFYYISSSTNPTDDQTYSVSPLGFPQWNYTTNAPSSSTHWSSPFIQIRRANFIINNVRTSTLSDSDKLKYEGIARMMRAYEYYVLVKKYGDVQWFSEVVDPADEEIVYGARDDRDMIMDSVLVDINYACATIPSGSKITYSNDMAQAIKSEICLYEGTFCKYRTLDDNGKAPDTSRAQKFLNECVNAGDALMNAGYSLCDNYQDVYNSESLESNPEVILYKSYKDGTLMHSLISYTLLSTTISGISKDAFDSYLFLDGKPKGVTSYDDTDVAKIPYEVDANGKPIQSEYSIKHLLDVRDSRLSQTTDSVIYFVRQEWNRASNIYMHSSSGYGVAKFDNVDLPLDSRNNNNRSYTDAPVFWLPVILCDYAEAKAELGTITQNDLDKTINLLYKRAGLPDLSVSVGFSDPANTFGVSDLIWEIRRCRRCELMCDGYRYWDLIRWHMLEKLDTTKYPDIMLGANVSEYTDWLAKYNAAAAAAGMDEIPGPEIDITSDGYIDATGGNSRVYDKKYYLYPIPTTQLSLNPNLTQNPGWPSTSSD